jgi:hypothetical protein
MSTNYNIANNIYAKDKVPFERTQVKHKSMLLKQYNLSQDFVGESKLKSIDQPKTQEQLLRTCNMSTRRLSSIEEVVDNINFNVGFLNSQKTMTRVENGFNYLRNLVSNLKTKTLKEKSSLDSYIQILCLKENVDYEPQKPVVKKGIFISYNRLFRYKRKFGD